MKRRRRRARAKEVQSVEQLKGPLTIRRVGRKKWKEPIELPPVETRLVKYLIKETHPRSVENSRTYHMPRYVAHIDHESAMLIKQYGCLEKKDFAKIITSRMATPNVTVMIENIIRYDVPDVPLDKESESYLVASERMQLSEEVRCGTVEFRRENVFSYGANVMSSFPGLSYRRMGRRTKRDVEELAPIEAVAARRDLMSGKTFRSRPCALFGRGKVVEGIDPGVASCSGGRLVMAPDGRDHLVMSTEAKGMMSAMRDCPQTSHVSIGLSFPNGGGAVWCANIVADLVGLKRVGPENSPEWQTVRLAQRINKWFKDTHESEYLYMNLDVSKQDTTIPRRGIESYFTGVFMVHKAFGKDQRRLSRILKWQREFHMNTRFCLPDGQVWRKQRGNVTGSPHTTLLNSWWQCVIVRAALLFIFNGRIPKGVTWRIYGDNTLLAYHHKYKDRLNMDTISDVLVEMFSSKINVEESKLCHYLYYDHGRDHEDVAVFLGKRIMTDGLTWRPLAESLVALVHPDSRDLSLDTRYSRLNGLMIDNPGNHEWSALVNWLLDNLESRGAQFKPLEPREQAKFIFGRGLPQEFVETPFRMRRQDVVLLYTSGKGDPSRDPFTAADRVPTVTRDNDGILHFF